MDKMMERLMELEKRIGAIEHKFKENDSNSNLIGCDFGDIIEERHWTGKDDTSEACAQELEFNVCGPPEFVKEYSSFRKKS